ncbi:MAG TPA: DUF2255 family protein [Thermoanaerobaculia bacterium]|nr:DUF2255 family protein [Thermoanaerobaculia bacterium]
MPARRFPPNVVASIDAAKILGIRAGKTHRVIGIWVVVVEGRVFVRSWTLKPDGWYHTFREDPHGIIEVGKRRIRVRAVQTRSERLKRAVDEAYAEKYPTPASKKYVMGFRRGRRRDSTTELVPE